MHALYFLLAVLFLISATYRVLDVNERAGELRHWRELVRAPFDVRLPYYEILAVREEAASARLREGDRITRINGQPLHYSARDLWVPLRAAKAGDLLRVDATRIERGHSTIIPAFVVLHPLRQTAPTALELVNFAVLNVLLPISCTALGFWVAVVAIRDVRAWLLLFMMLGLVEFAGGNFRFLFGREDFFQPIAAAYQPVLANLWSTALLLFAIYFPDRLEFDRRVPWLKWLLIAPIVVRVLGNNPVFQYLARRNPEAALGLRNALDPLAPYVLATSLLFIVGFVAIMGFRTLTERQPDARRRLQLLDAGVAVSLIPILVFLGFFVAGDRDTFVQWMALPVVGLLFVACLFLFPLTMAYVIVVRRAMEVRVAVRQGVQYVLARGGIRLVQLAVMIAASIAAASVLSGDPGIFRVALVIAGFMAVVALGGRFADRLREWVDRRFFREAYDAEQILNDLALQVRTMIEAPRLLQTVAQRVSETLHVPRVAILLNKGGRLRPAYAVGFPDLPDVVLSEESATVRELQRDPHARLLFNDPDSGAPELSQEERESLVALHSDVLLPLALNQKVLGILSLGPKRSEEPYTSSDLRMLESVAMQTGLALENSRLTIEIAAAIAEREKRRRELEIAREVQQRFFPQASPSIPGLEYAGACRPALEVGGDYYDFLTLSPIELGIAVGDVSGKGIPAALLMATLRAFLHGASAGERNLPEMMLQLNSLIYESSATNRYATFFFGRYNSATRVLDYVNAGHIPPMLFRACGRHAPDVVRLQAGGPVIGLLPTCRYEQGSVELGSGDVLIAFTDGISEAVNADDEEWGEERLTQAVISARALEPKTLIERIMAVTDCFVGNAPQHDDMTLFIARCN
ncbi:MAG: SpoIIE family protein phosphatase [Vicinamibacterales bacterium]